MRAFIANIRQGVTLGAIAAGVLAGWATIIFALNGFSPLGREDRPITYGQIVAVYLAAGLSGGFVGGALRPLCRHPVVGALVGACAALPAALVADWQESGRNPLRAGVGDEAWYIALVAIGAGVGWKLTAEAERRRAARPD